MPAHGLAANDHHARWRFGTYTPGQAGECTYEQRAGNRPIQLDVEACGRISLNSLSNKSPWGLESADLFSVFTMSPRQLVISEYLVRNLVEAANRLASSRCHYLRRSRQC